MTRRLLIILTIVFVTIFSCQKKPFKRVTVTGRLIDMSTQLPLANTEIHLYTNDATSASSYRWNTIRLKSAVTDDNGTFRLSSTAAKEGEYYIRYGKGKKTTLVNGHESFTVADNSKKDVGDVIAKP